MFLRARLRQRRRPGQPRTAGAGASRVAKARSTRAFAFQVSLLVAAPAGRAAPGVNHDEGDRDGDGYENCPEHEPARPAPAGAPLLFSVCAHTSNNVVDAQTDSSLSVPYTRSRR